jgi:hypothetical protein
MGSWRSWPSLRRVSRRPPESGQRRTEQDRARLTRWRAFSCFGALRPMPW